MCFRTKVDVRKASVCISHDSRIILFGSCFADNIGTLLAENKFVCLQNPYGTLYNPLSISKALNEILSGRRYNEDDLFYHQGLYHSFMHHSSYSADNKERCLEKINSSIEKAYGFVRNADFIVMTFGTSFVYRLEGNVVSNCHKMPEKMFERHLCRPDEFVNEYKSLLEKLFLINPDLKIIFTISPIRHVRDTMHGNMVSKSVLAVFVNEIQELFKDKTIYFPAFEIMNDELRDYRFYDEDMIHPSNVAVKYIWEQFSKMFFDRNTINIIEKCSDINKMLQHKPFNPDSEQYTRFLNKINNDIDNLLSKHPSLNFGYERDLLRSLLKK